MLRRVRYFLEIIRFSHTIFALPFALIGALLAWQSKQTFQFIEFIGILLCMIFARGAAMAFNRLADCRIDALNPRTAKRHLPAGTIRGATVWIFTLIASAGFLLSTALFLYAKPPNPWPVILCVPVLLFLFAYSFTKRFTSLSHVCLGASLMMAPLAAWIAIRGMYQLEVPIVLGLAVLFWVSGFDVIYACQDFEFDRRQKLHSIPVRLGVAGALRFALGCHILMLIDLLLLWYISPHLGNLYLCGVVFIAFLLGYEHSLVRPNDLARVNRAFFHVNGAISLGLLVVVAAQLVVHW
jgi:4-hydroxybenzoate polyprenyltransferase